MTLQQDLAGDFLLFLLALTALVWVGVWVGHLIRKNPPDQTLNPAPEPHECNIGGCHQPATHAWPTGIPGVTYYVCTPHTATVRSWAGPYDRPVYDQDIDGTDLGRWEQEMQS